MGQAGRNTYWMYGWLHLIGNNELDGRRLERVLWIEPDHELKDLILNEVYLR